MIIKKAAVIGAGTMGAGIATHLANAGVPSLLLDVVPDGLSADERKDPRARSRLAHEAIKRQSGGKAPAFMNRADAGTAATTTTSKTNKLSCFDI